MVAYAINFVIALGIVYGRFCEQKRLKSYTENKGSVY